MKIKIANLYPKELTLYGESGNIKALKYYLEQNNIDVEIIEINKKDKLNLKEYDFVYIGSGRDVFLSDIKKRLEEYKEDFLNYINKDKVILATGMGIYILEMLGLYEVEYKNVRKVSDVEARTDICNGKIFGFQNTHYFIKNTNNTIFTIDKGFGNNDGFMEGYHQNNFYATSSIGPILARNKELVKYIGNILIDNKRG